MIKLQLFQYITLTIKKQRDIQMNIKNNPCYITEDKLKIIIRIRPILKQQQTQQFIKLQDDHTLQIKKPGNFTLMKFNNILSINSTQQHVFNLLQNSIHQFLNGINITIFAYGQTGAGKTYSIIGNYSLKDNQQNIYNFLSSKQKGILSRSLEMIMYHLHQKQHSSIFISFFQIYNQKIFDLYKYNKKPLDILQSKNGQISIPQLYNYKIQTMQQAIQYLIIGLKNRATRSTQANSQSSRSHSIFRINLQKINHNLQTIYSSLRIVDLAGSQKFKIPSDLSPIQRDTRIQQLTSINGSLSCLGHCISSLIEKSRTHIPFRNSKLTRILSDSLQGKGKMRFIICISPSISASAETFSTLQFANRAKKAIFERSEIKSLNISKKQCTDNQQLITLKKQLQKQRQQRTNLEKQLTTLQNKKQQNLLKQNTNLKIQNKKLKQQLKQFITKQNNHHQNYLLQHASINHHDLLSNKQNFNHLYLKQQMLKLPIFQDNQSLSIFQTQLANSKNIQSILQQKNICKFNKNYLPINKKKIQFLKKIKKFIQSDSPSHLSTNINQSQKKSPKQYRLNFQCANKIKNIFNLQKKQNISNHSKKHNINYIHHNQVKSLWANDEKRNHNEMEEKNYSQKKRKATTKKQDNSQNKKELYQQWVQNENTQQFIEQACENMNLPDYQDLKFEMNRAKQQLILLKQRDNQISKNKKFNDFRRM